MCAQRHSNGASGVNYARFRAAKRALMRRSPAALEMPTASRAVARACATNPIALVVPCHRVVRGDGNLAGYRWGIERKARLLEAEKTKELL